jgi:hypothetical protein
MIIDLLSITLSLKRNINCYRDRLGSFNKLKTFLFKRLHVNSMSNKCRNNRDF